MQRRGGRLWRARVGGSRALLRLATPAAEQPPVPLALNGRVLLFTIAVSAVTCLLFGLIPALRATSRGRFTAARQLGAPRHRFVYRVLVVSQVALSLTLHRNRRPVRPDASTSSGRRLPGTIAGTS